jgi:two-component system phosphate regulon response regulator PhoB
MEREHILVVEDEESILELITYNLRKDGYHATGVMSGEDAIEEASEQLPDLVLLDLMLPGLNGLEVCKKLKGNKKTESIPIIILTAKGEEADIVAGLEMGSDDYIVKPFSPKVLLARIKAVLRRNPVSAVNEETPVAVSGLSIHPGRHEVLVDNKQVELTYTEFKVLHFLAGRPGWVFTRYQIVESVRGDNYPVTDRSVDVLIVGLRKKLGIYGHYIETVRGVGYRFKEGLSIPATTPQA